MHDGQKRAGEVGFEWPSPEPVLDKFAEEVEEIRGAIKSGKREQIPDELGDLLFVTANLARQLDIDAAAALRHANNKFEKRFRAMEAAVGGPQALDGMDLAEMEELWQRIKRKVKTEHE